MKKISIVFTFSEEEATKKHMSYSTTWSSLINRRQIRVQDANLQEMRDDGWCL